MATSRSSSRKAIQRSAAKKAKRPSTVMQKTKASKGAIKSEIATRRATSGTAEPVPAKRAKIVARRLKTTRKAAAPEHNTISKVNSSARHDYSKTSKTATVLDMLRHPDGTTIGAIMAATSWQPHSVGGFFAGVVKNRLGLNLVSAKVGNERVYHIADDGSVVRQVSRGSAGRAGARG